MAFDARTLFRFAITGGIAEARIAMATGLCVALMTLLPYNYFRAKVDQLTERMEEQATRLELFLSRREVSTYDASIEVARLVSP